jgi:hypothetical protein
MSEPIPDAELAALQTALTRLSPAPDGINVAQLMFRAGQASVPRRGWAWPGATALSLLLATGLGVVLALRPEPPVVERFVMIPMAATQAEPSPGQEPAALVLGAPPRESQAAKGDSLKLRQLVLTRGLDALPAPSPWPDTAPPPRNLDTLLDLPADAVQERWFLRLKHSLPSGDAS